MTACRRRAHQAVRPSPQKGEGEVPAVGEVDHPLGLEEVDLETLLIREEEEGEMDPLVIPLEGEDTLHFDQTSRRTEHSTSTELSSGPSSEW